jgi:ribosomal protein S18 acetylase RimI-like enzyme
MDAILVRGVEEDDLVPIVGLLQQLKEYSHSDSKPNLVQVKKLYSEMLSNPQQYKNMVASVSGAVVGFISVVYYKSFLSVGGTALINELVVSGLYRRSGIGSALVQAAVHIARRDEMDQIEVGTERANESATSFYKRLGFNIEYRLFGMSLAATRAS